mgnify:CR=1 FL=1
MFTLGVIEIPSNEPHERFRIWFFQGEWIVNIASGPTLELAKSNAIFVLEGVIKQLGSK